MISLRDVAESVIIRERFDTVAYWHVTDRWTDRWTVIAVSRSEYMHALHVLVGELTIALFL